MSSRRRRRLIAESIFDPALEALSPLRSVYGRRTARACESGTRFEGAGRLRWIAILGEMYLLNSEVENLGKGYRYRVFNGFIWMFFPHR